MRINVIFFIYILIITTIICIHTFKLKDNNNILNTQNKEEERQQICPANYSLYQKICLKNCPEGDTTVGALCKKKFYTRKGPYTSKKLCKDKNKPHGCEIWGLLYYVKCKKDHKSFGCCQCFENCKDGMVEIGHDSCKRYMKLKDKES